MSSKANSFKLGLFTIFGVALLGTGVLAFGTWSSFAKKSLYETYVPGDVSGLSVGSAVEFRGVRVGKVTHIGFSWTEYQDSQPGFVVVEFEMRDDAFVAPMGSHWKEQLQAAIDRGLRARIKAQGVTGTCIISFEYLDPGEYPVEKYAWTPKNTFVPSAPGLFGVLLESLHKSLIRLDHLDVAALNEMAQKDLKSAGRVLDGIAKVDFENLSTNIVALLQDLRVSSAKLNRFIDDTDDTVKKLQLEKLSKDADALVLELEDTVAKLEPGLTSIDFDSLNQTLAKARRTLQNVNDVLNELKEYPSGFIFGQPPPRLKELQPTNH
jgi:phospholipid/cholesterol/gamma-HCH transport system substrate-binding protein